MNSHMDTSSAPRALIVGAGAGGLFCAERLLADGWSVHQVSDRHLHTTTLLVAAGLIEPVGADQPGRDTGDLIVIDPAAGTAETLAWCRQLVQSEAQGVVERDVLLLGPSDADVDVPWAAAVDGFGPAEPPPGQTRYSAARTYRTFVVQPDLLVRRMLDEFHASERWRYERRRLDNLDAVFEFARTVADPPELIVVAAGNYSGVFSERSAVRSAIGLVARQHTSSPIAATQSVTVSTTDTTFPYDIPATTMRTFGGSFLAGFDPADLAAAHVDDFAHVREEIVEALGDVGISVPPDVTWLMGGRPVHPLGPHARLDVDGPIPVVHVAGLSGSGVTDGRSIGAAAVTLGNRALRR
ncbi:MAG: FAD-dependent oxidoreductase [Actinomycetota bacterium]